MYRHIDASAAEKIKEDMYVDDLGAGGNTREEVLSLKKNVEIILSKGGFHMKGFVMSGDSSETTLSLLGSG